MKTKYSALCILTLLLGSALFFTSCRKEELQVSQSFKQNPGNLSLATVANDLSHRQSNTLTGPLIPSPNVPVMRYIGQRFGGGVIFYLSGDGHGLVADTVD